MTRTWSTCFARLEANSAESSTEITTYGLTTVTMSDRAAPGVVPAASVTSAVFTSDWSAGTIWSYSAFGTAIGASTTAEANTARTVAVRVPRSPVRASWSPTFQWCESAALRSTATPSAPTDAMVPSISSTSTDVPNAEKSIPTITVGSPGAVPDVAVAPGRVTTAEPTSNVSIFPTEPRPRSRSTASAGIDPVADCRM